MVLFVRMKVMGKVQGVFYRAFVRTNALELGIRGTVKNMRDGSVEIVCEAKDELHFQQFAEAVTYNNRAGIKVENVDILERKRSDDFSFHDFRIIYD